MPAALPNVLMPNLVSAWWHGWIRCQEITRKESAVGDILKVASQSKRYLRVHLHSEHNKTPGNGIQGCCVPKCPKKRDTDSLQA